MTLRICADSVRGMAMQVREESEGRPPLRVLALIPALNVGRMVVDKVLRRIPKDLVERALVIDDGSTDDTAEQARRAGAAVVSHAQNQGVGAALRTGLGYAKQHGFDTVVILNSLGKFDPADLGVLLAPLQDGSADLVQGSRFVAGGGVDGMPMKRHLGTRAYSGLFSLLLGRSVTDASSGIRAFRCSILDTPGLDLNQTWLDRYELEPYLLWKSIQLGLRVVEVPMNISYPDGPRESYTRMKPIRDWWRISRPLLILTAERFGLHILKGPK